MQNQRRVNPSWLCQKNTDQTQQCLVFLTQSACGAGCLAPVLQNQLMALHVCTYVCAYRSILSENPKHVTSAGNFWLNPRFTLKGVLSFVSEKLLVPVSKNESKPLQTLPSLAKPAAALQTFNSAILTPVSNNNTGFLRNLLNSSGGKVCEKFWV